MKRRLAIAFMLLLVVALTIALVLERWGRTDWQPVTVIAPMLSTSNGAAPHEAPVRPPVPVAATASKPASRPNDLAQGLGSKGDARTYVLEAWQRPEVGGRLYANRLVQRCIFLRQAGPEASELGEQVSAEDLAKAQEALKFLQMRCSQFSEGELESHSHEALVRSDDGRRDRLLGLLRALSSARDEKSRASALQAVLDSQDPLLLDELGAHIAVHGDSKGTFLFFRDQRYYFKTEPILYGAFYLVPCAFGMPCGDTDMDLARQCAAGAGCYATRFDKARAEYANTPQRYAELMAAYEDLVAAIRARDVDAFRLPD